MPFSTWTLLGAPVELPGTSHLYKTWRQQDFHLGSRRTHGRGGREGNTRRRIGRDTETVLSRRCG
jgi:hypothetical protein